MDVPKLNQPRAGKRDIRQLLEDGRTQSLMKSLATRHLTPERLTRLAVIACNKVPKLLECEPQTLLGAFLGCSALGLEPDTPLQHLHLIPYGTSVQVVIGYRGYLELGRRSGLITGMHADVVYPDDLFEHEYGTNTFLRHQSRDWPGAETDYTHAYCHVALKDGQAFVVMPKAAILRIRDGSQGYQTAKKYNKKDSPWMAHEARMARKTPIRQLFGGGEVPLSLELAGAVSIDEQKVDFSALTHASAEQIKEDMGSFAQHGDDATYKEDVDADGVVTQAQIEHQTEQEVGPVEQPETAPKMAEPRARGGNSAEAAAAPGKDMFR